MEIEGKCHDAYHSQQMETNSDQSGSYVQQFIYIYRSSPNKPIMK